MLDKWIKEELSLSGNEKISDFPKKFNKLVGIVEKLVNVVSFLLAIVITFLGQALLSGKLAQLFHFFNVDWNQLSEGYQILLLGVPLMIIAGVATHFINKKYVDPLIEKKDG